MTTTQVTIARLSALSNAPAGIFAMLGVIDVALILVRREGRSRA
jgi:hypothetical protein